MIVIHKNYAFSEQDAGKTVILANGQIAKIISVIREYGQIYDVVGRTDDNVIIWNHQGKTIDEELCITAIVEK